MSVSIKICGLTDEAAVRAVAAGKVEYAGFVHFPASPRHIQPADAARLRALLPAATQVVSVLVDPGEGLLSDVCNDLKPHFLQLHGKETPERLREIRAAYPSVKLIKALKIRSSDDVAGAYAYRDVADALLFDARAPDLPGILPGGNGLSFDWALLKGRDFSLPWLLSGGLNSDNVAQAVRISGAPAVDISSGIESAPGVKDPALIVAFIKTVRSI